MKKIIATLFVFLCIGQAFAISVGDVAITTESNNKRNSIVIVKSLSPDNTAVVKILNYPTNVANSNGEYKVSVKSLIPTVKEIKVDGVTFRTGQIVKAKMFKRVNSAYVLYTFSNKSMLVMNADDQAGIELFKKNGTQAFEDEIYGLYLKSCYSSETEIWW